MGLVGANERNCWQADASRVDLTRARRPPDQVVISARPQQLVLDLVTTACVVVDMQNDFCAPGGWLDYDPDGASLGIGGALPGSGGHVLEAGSWSAAIVDELDADAADIAIDKFRMSGFFDTELDSVLRNLAVSTVLFAGVNMDQCVLATLTDAACLGYDVVLLDDCAATTSPDFCRQATLYNVAQCFGFVSSGAAVRRGLADR